MYVCMAMACVAMAIIICMYVCINMSIICNNNVYVCM
jgi:hypothetical protein